MAKMPNQLRHPLWKRQCQSLRFRPIRMQRLWKLVFFRPLFHHHLRQCLHLQALPSLRLLNQRKPNHQQSQHNHQHQNRSQQGRVSNRIFPMGQLARLGVEMWSTVFTNHAIKSSPLFYIVFLLNSHMIILSKHRSAPCQTKLRLASKARLARWMKPKGCRKDLVAPEWIRKEWDSSDRNALAEMFVNANFDKVPLLMSCQFS